MEQQYRPSRKNLVVDREPDLHKPLSGLENDSRLLIPADSAARRHTTLSRQNKPFKIINPGSLENEKCEALGNYMYFTRRSKPARNVY